MRFCVNLGDISLLYINLLMAFALFAVSAVTRIVSPVTVRPDSLMLFSLESSAANFIYLIINGLQHIFTTMASPELTQNLR